MPIVRSVTCLLCAVLLLTCGRSAPQPDDDRLTATFWFSYGGRNREVLQELLDAFHASQDRYRVDATFQGSYFEALAKLRTALITDDQPTFTHVVGEVLPYLWDAGVLTDLTPFAAGELPLSLDDMIPALTQDGYFDYGGRGVPLFSLPFNRSTPIAFYNRDLFDAEGVRPPETWEELRETAQRLTRREGDQTQRWGFEVPIDWWFWVALLYQSDGALLSPDGGSPRFDGPAGVEALAFLVELVNEHQVMRPPPGRDYSAWEVTNNDFLAGKAAMIWTSTAFLSYLTDNADFEVGAAPLPANVRHGVPTGGTFFVMLEGASVEEQEAAWAFLHFMMQPEQTAHWSRRTGYMPVDRRALDLPEMVELYNRDPNYRVALDQLEHAVKFPFSPSLFTIQRQHIQPRLERPVLGMGTAFDELGRAADAAQETLSVYHSACGE